MTRRIPEQQLNGLTRAATRLLHVESFGPRELSLRFDRGSLAVMVVDGGIELELGGGAALSPDADPLDEADPWWTVIGQPLIGAWSLVDADERRVMLELQLRPDDENPKIVTLEPRGVQIRTRAMPKSEWDGAK